MKEPRYLERLDEICRKYKVLLPTQLLIEAMIKKEIERGVIMKWFMIISLSASVGYFTGHLLDWIIRVV